MSSEGCYLIERQLYKCIKGTQQAMGDAALRPAQLPEQLGAGLLNPHQ